MTYMPASHKFTTSFNRPANTTDYDVGDAVSDNVTAGSVTKLSWVVGTVGSAITRVRVRKSDQTVTPTLRVWFYDASFTVGAGDNVAFVHPVANTLGYVDVAVTTAGSDDAVGWQACNIDIGRVSVIYGELQSQSVFTPASAETFTVDIWVGPPGGSNAASVSGNATEATLATISTNISDLKTLQTAANASLDDIEAAAESTASVAVAGDIAHDAADSGSPVKIGARARSSEIAAVANNDRTDLITDLVGKLIMLPYANPENFVSGAITSAMTGTTTTSLLAAPASGLRNYITQITVSNSHATVGTDVIIQDGSGGTTLYTIPAAAVYGGAVLTFPVPLRQPTTATAIFCANVTTGASTKVSASGYKGA